MMQKAFLFPGLRHMGYASGLSIPLKGEVQRTPDLNAEILMFSRGCLAARHEVPLGEMGLSGSLFYRGWDMNWFPEPVPAAGDELFCMRLTSPAYPERALPQSDIECQMLLRQKDDWVSSVLTGMVPLRAPGYRYAPIIHTAHYIASEPEVETITLFMNIRDVSSAGPMDGGVLNADVSARTGEYLGTVQFPVRGNATVAISSDDLIRELNLSGTQSSQGINVKFWGGASQFSIVTVYRNRANGSIGMEHSLAPIYYLPGLRDPKVRALVYQQLESKR
jgi:hypothetical protein